MDIATTSSQRARAYGEGRAALLDATIQSVASDGLRNLTYRGVARRAGVAHALVTHHFGDRAALLEAALELSLDRTLSFIDHAELSGADLETLFIGLVETSQSASDDTAFQFEVALESRRRPELRHLLDLMYRRYREYISRELERQGIDAEPALVHLVVSAIDGLVFAQTCFDDKEATKSGMATLRGILAGLRREPSATSSSGSRHSAKV